MNLLRWCAQRGKAEVREESLITLDPVVTPSTYGPATDDSFLLWTNLLTIYLIN